MKRDTAFTFVELVVCVIITVVIVIIILPSLASMHVSKKRMKNNRRLRSIHGAMI